MRLAQALLLLSLVTTTAACTSSDDGASSRPSQSRTASTSSTAATQAAVPPAPRGGACYRLVSAQLTRPTNSSKPVPCSNRHTTRTIFVGRLRTIVDGHSLSVDSDQVQRQLATTCPRKLAAYVGGSVKARNLSRFDVSWFTPTLDQAAQGASWFRCDLVAFADASRLYPLPPARRLEGALRAPTGLATYGLCGSAAPGTRGFRRVICARPHAWRAFDTVPLRGGKAYPGVSRVRTAGDSVCKKLSSARSGDALKFQYGWEWPSRAQWLGGQHFGYCWGPTQGAS